MFSTKVTTARSVNRAEPPLNASVLMLSVRPYDLSAAARDSSFDR